jgi:predicted dehydrogenase
LRVLRQYWPGIDVSVFRSGHGPACQEAELADNIFFCFDQALEWSPEAAIIASPASDHLNRALPLAKIGVPLLIEKPVGSGNEPPSDWDELINLSRKLPISVAYVLRHDPCIDFVRSQLYEGQLGTLIDADFYSGSWLPDWRPGLDYRKTVSARRDQGGGALLELSHEIDLADWLLGPLELDSAMLQQSGLLEVDVEDQAALICRTSGNCAVTIRLNFCTAPPKRYILLRGSTGEIACDLVDGWAQVSKKNSLEIDKYIRNIPADDRYYLQMKHFLESVRGLASPMCSLHEGLNTLSLAMKAGKGRRDFIS